MKNSLVLGLVIALVVIYYLYTHMYKLYGYTANTYYLDQNNAHGAVLAGPPATGGANGAPSTWASCKAQCAANAQCCGVTVSANGSDCYLNAAGPYLSGATAPGNYSWTKGSCAAPLAS